MKFLSKFLIISLLGAMTTTIKAQEQQIFDYSKLIEAITYIESRGDAKAFNPRGNCAGILQITPVCMNECNNILQTKGEKKRYTLQDRFNPQKSVEMFILIQEKYNPTHDIEKAIRMWNGGPHYTVGSTNGYYKKVFSKYQEILNKEKEDVMIEKGR